MTMSDIARHERDARLARYYAWVTPLLMSPPRRRTGIMHKEIWAAGVRTRAQALLHVSGLVEAGIAPAIAQAGAGARVIDMGCGIGGTAVYLGTRLDVQVVGLTLSRFQAAKATRRAARAGAGDRCRFVVADFLTVPVPGRVAAAYALESFAHCVDPARFFAVVADLLEFGGRFVLFDEILGEAGGQSGGSKARAWVERFRHGWQLGSLLTAGDIERLAGAAGLGLVDATDLSAAASRRSDFALWLTMPMVHLPVPGPLWGALAGATAGEVCLREGWLKCQIFVFEKVARSAQ